MPVEGCGSLFVRESEAKACLHAHSDEPGSPYRVYTQGLARLGQQTLPEFFNNNEYAHLPYPLDPLDRQLCKQDVCDGSHSWGENCRFCGPKWQVTAQLCLFRAQPGCLGRQFGCYSGGYEGRLAGVREQGMATPSRKLVLPFGVKVDLQSACRVRLV